MAIRMLQTVKTATGSYEGGDTISGLSPVLEAQLIDGGSAVSTAGEAGVIPADKVPAVLGLVSEAGNDDTTRIVYRRHSIWDWSLDSGAERLDLPSPYFDGSDESRSMVHPSLVFAPQGFAGYRYWLAVTPYVASNSATENPCILASNDLKTWVAVASNPVVPKPASGATDYNADCHLVLHTDGYLYLMWRERRISNSTNYLRASRSRDGASWEAPVTLRTGATTSQDYGSPSFWHNGSAWVIVSGNLDAAGFPLQRFERAGDLLADWSAVLPTTVTPPHPDSTTWWHASCHRLADGRVVAVASDGTAAGGGLWLWQSDTDGASWSVRRLSRLNKHYRCALLVTDERVAMLLGYISGAAPIWQVLLQPMRIGNRRATRSEAIDRAESAYGINANDRAVLLHGDAFTGTAAALSAPWVQVDANTINLDGSGRATNANTNNCRATIDLAVSDYVAQVDLAARPGSAQLWLMVRFVDTNNFIRVGINGSNNLRVERLVGGAVQDGGGFTLAVADPTASLPGTLRVECDGSQVDVFWRGTLVHRLAATSGVTATKVGLQASSGAGALFDNFLAHALG